MVLSSMIACCLLDADNVRQESLVLTGLQVVHTAKEILIVSDGEAWNVVCSCPKNLLQNLSDKEHVSCKFLQ